ncbi:MAG: hypothetical protein ACRDOO_22105 [Actinomadura sp.]
MAAVDQLLDRSRGPLGPPVDLNLQPRVGPLGELADLLGRSNGFTVFNAGVQVFRAGERGLGPELREWNQQDTWKQAYGRLADGLFCFAQDLFGVQFAVVDQRAVVAVDPETADRTHIGDTLDAWAAWLLDDPDVRGAYQLATVWQDRHGALTHDQRLIPRRFFTLGGGYDLDNLVAKDAAECMRIRGPIAQMVHDLPDGAHLRLHVE